MSPRSVVTREDWMAAGRELISQGHIPADWPLAEIGKRVGAGVSTGSLYSHFPGGGGEYYAALIEEWGRASLAELLPPGEARAVRDPKTKLRLIRSRWAASALSGGAMRCWATRAGLPQRTKAEKKAVKAAQAAQAAVDAVDHAVTGQVRQALEHEDFGLAGEYPAVVADVMVSSWIGKYHLTAPAAAADDGGAGEVEAERKFDVFLDFIAGVAEAGRRGAEVAMARGKVPAEVLLYLIARGLSEEGRRELLAQVQQFIDGQDELDGADDPPGGTLPAAEGTG